MDRRSTAPLWARIDSPATGRHTSRQYMMSELVVPKVAATRENIAAYGILIGTDVPAAGLAIPFYKGAVEEGHNLPFQYHDRATIRTARIHPRPGAITWLERHARLTQLFVGLGDAPFCVVLGKPNLDQPQPDLSSLVAFVFQPGHGVMIHAGTWHDFPMAIDRPVTVLTMNSEEVVEALASQQEPAEMNRGDVFKLDVERRTGVKVRVAA
jgi:ureidoglycolate lyase